MEDQLPAVGERLRKRMKLRFAGGKLRKEHRSIASLGQLEQG
jgi:hypothetical protein